MKRETYKTYHIFFCKLSNPLRIKIISSLNKKEKSVSELVKELKVEQSKLSHALGELRDCSIVNVKQKGKERIYSLSPTIKPILKLIDIHANACCKKECKCCEACE